MARFLNKIQSELCISGVTSAKETAISDQMLRVYVKFILENICSKCIMQLQDKVM